MTKENEMPEYVYLGYQPDDGYVGKSYYAEETPEIGIDTRYALCPEGSFVVSRDVLEGMIEKRCEHGVAKTADGHYTDGKNQAINDILKIGESDEK